MAYGWQPTPPTRRFSERPSPLYETQVGQLLEKRELSPGLILEKRSASLGVVLVIFEARPEALPQIAAYAIDAPETIGLSLPAAARVAEVARALGYASRFIRWLPCSLLATASSAGPLAALFSKQ